MPPPDNRAWILVLPALAVLVFVGLIPLISVINYSFFDIFTLKDRFWVGTEWYADLLRDPALWAALGRSALFTALVVFIQFPLGVGIALLLPRNALWGSVCVMVLAMPLVVPWNMIPGIWLGFVDVETGLAGRAMAALGIGFDYKFNAWHSWALILAMDTWHWVGLVAILSYSGLSAIPGAYYQAAAIDGAGRVQIFRHVELPRLTGVLMMALVLRVMDSLMIYTEAFGINAGGPDGATTFLALDLGEEIAAFNYGPAAARSVLYVLLVLTLAWAFTLVLRGLRERS
ncbi:sugar ABC transporter permease [Sulfitobacter albidus]|uniref:Sugar ABC transporter permease n=1 Tax=Sulfitobacter albidus TaxID=2829501 RepID=A0A975PMI0_9RHOB|nr:sugar ABC transporter permease [Sulfitobacter albidus]QUJ76744.1 sugar ABC transporter permease [Sulfitobacter albidus]